MGMPIIEGSNTTKIQALTDILVSISLEEAAIAHILNAEGEKIQKVVADQESTTCELLCINKSVDTLAETLTNLVMLLKSKTKLVLNDKCFACFCDNPCAGFDLLLEATDGIITLVPNTDDEYNLVVDAGATSSTVTATILPPTALTITNVVGVGVTAVAVGNQIEIDQIGPTFAGTVTATLTLANGCINNITIHVTQEPLDCDAFELILTATENGILTPIVPGTTYNFNIVNIALISRILAATIPASGITITNLATIGDISAIIDPTGDIFVISTSPGGTYIGTIFATIHYGNGCSSDVLIYVSPLRTL
jgi:hypothetical protein